MKNPWKRGFPLFRQTQIWIPAELQTISTFLYICGLFCYTYISVKVWLLHLWNLALNFKSGFALSCRSLNCWVANVSFSPRQVPSRNRSPKKTGHPKIQRLAILTISKVICGSFTKSILTQMFCWWSRNVVPILSAWIAIFPHVIWQWNSQPHLPQSGYKNYLNAPLSWINLNRLKVKKILPGSKFWTYQRMQL